VRPAPSTRRQPAILLVVAALWSAHGLPADLARQMVAERLNAASSISQSSRAKVLLSGLSTKVSNAKQFDLRPFLEQLLALSSDTALAGLHSADVPLLPRVTTAVAWSHFRPALFQRPPPHAFLA
jgi:hypothetical protein